MHQDRVRAVSEQIKAAEERLIAQLESIDEAVATKRPADNGWSPAQVGWHIGHTNEMLAAIMTGAIPMAQPAPADFREQEWGSMAIPAKIQTMPQLEPPAEVTRAEAIEKIRNAGKMVTSAFGTLPENRAGQVVSLPFGTLSMYQVGEFVAKHADRHLAQIKRCIATTA